MAQNRIHFSRFSRFPRFHFPNFPIPFPPNSPISFSPNSQLDYPTPLSSQSSPLRRSLYHPLPLFMNSIHALLSSVARFLYSRTPFSGIEGQFRSSLD
ncbi:hypothetical protein ERO13_D13G098825v2 [Gossypium hirsutum]|nr:hypothetical protein ERO13_D13G098825v2 [Gossypium hirsutum]